MASIADYPAALRRIVDADIPDDATTRDEILSFLRSSDAPQITPENAADAADAITSYEDVVAAIENTGEIPRSEEIDSIARALDEYDLDLTDEVVEDVSGDIATREDFEDAVRSSDPTFREDVEDAVDSVSSSKDVVGGSTDDIVDDLARQASAPSQAEFSAGVAESVESSDIRVEEVVEDPPGTGGLNTVRDESGEVVAVQAASRMPSENVEAAAEELGADRIESTQELVDNTEVVAEGGGRASLEFRGRKIGEVQV
jgi:hypothetical protein